MLAEGIESTRITEGPYDASGARAAPLVISYRTYDAVVPNCPDISHWDFAWTGANSALPSFGCAVAVNLAAQIADPSDLVGEQRIDPSDIGRRTILLTKYRNGENYLGRSQRRRKRLHQLSGQVGTFEADMTGSRDKFHNDGELDQLAHDLDLDMDAPIGATFAAALRDKGGDVATADDEGFDLDDDGFVTPHPRQAGASVFDSEPSPAADSEMAFDSDDFADDVRTGAAGRSSALGLEPRPSPRR